MGMGEGAVPDEVQIIRLPMPLRMGTVNCYLIQMGAVFALIDTGPSGARGELERELRQRGCTPGSLTLIILTHGDFDHIGNAAHLRSTFGAQIVMHGDDAGMAERGDMFVNRRRPNFLIRTLLPALTGFGPAERFTPDLLAEDGLSLKGYGLPAMMIGLPGHSRGSVGIRMESGVLYCGDLFENTKRPALNSLMDDASAGQASLAKLGQMGIQTVFPGHGEPFDFGLLAEAGNPASG